MEDQLENLGFIDRLKRLLFYLIVEASKDPWEAAKTILTCMMPLFLLAAVLAYKLQMSLNKQKRQRKAERKKDKLVQKLKSLRMDEAAAIEKQPKVIESQKTIRARERLREKQLDEKEMLKMAEMVCEEPLKEAELVSNQHLKSE